MLKDVDLNRHDAEKEEEEINLEIKVSVSVPCSYRLALCDTIM